ncbi:Helix-turn-helix protein [Rhizobium leguminosarum bv. trifolii WSM2297]|uniref:Helix-turn-helix protein n=1 Tax=Rhizobium leguminosarum bv. trifolii WSM2297 TaxID=754762 RepID=J0L1K4_RHILT|nr:helix-turn-helix transcriptional regulator [Rhizobium leguminosarum]EJC84059.1 Helix-turn-helix protein [Rhizobium leguminosarum bv. trifolii WSM2297]EJC84350.1 Helix-turn-helix protein [Rhizobium leguminosarum bv. trifolii WSM2297]
MKASELIQAREQLDFTQAELANRLGLPLVEIQQLESGNREISTIHVLAFDMIRLQAARERKNVATLPPDLQSLVNHLGRQLYPS